jgi:hypothetical protein
LRLGGEDDDRRLVLPQVVEEELAQALAIERGARRAALVQLVDDAPDRAVAVALAVGESEVRVAQAVLAQVLAGAGDDDDAGAALRQPHGGVFGELHRLRHCARARRPLLAAATGVGGGRCRDQRRSERETAQRSRAHRVILSL